MIHPSFYDIRASAVDQMRGRGTQSGSLIEVPIHFKRIANRGIMTGEGESSRCVPVEYLSLPFEPGVVGGFVMDCPRSSG